MSSEQFNSHYNYSAPPTPLFFSERGSYLTEVKADGAFISRGLYCLFTCSKVERLFFSISHHLIPATWTCNGNERQGYVDEYALMTYCFQNSNPTYKNQVPEFPQERFHVFCGGKMEVDLRTDADISRVIQEILSSVGIGRKDRGVTFVGKAGIQ